MDVWIEKEKERERERDLDKEILNSQAVMNTLSGVHYNIIKYNFKKP
jgi:hypothetical protein